MPKCTKKDCTVRFCDGIEHFFVDSADALREHRENCSDSTADEVRRTQNILLDAVNNLPEPVSAYDINPIIRANRFNKGEWKKSLYPEGCKHDFQ